MIFLGVRIIAMIIVEDMQIELSSNVTSRFLYQNLI